MSFQKPYHMQNDCRHLRISLRGARVLWLIHHFVFKNKNTQTSLEKQIIQMLRLLLDSGIKTC